MKLTTANLQAGRQAVEQDLITAREEHSRAAYAAALDRNDEIARKTLVACKQRMDLLAAELEGLAAAGKEATRLEGNDAVQEAIGACSTQRDEALAAVDAVEAAFARTEQALGELGGAYKALQEAEERSNRLEARCGPLNLHGNNPPTSFRTREIVAGVAALHVGEHFQPQRSVSLQDTGGRPIPDAAAQQIARAAERARGEIERGIAKRIDGLRARLLGA
jgi:hypothetical protein